MALTSIEFAVPTAGERGDIADNEIPISALRICQNMIRGEKGRLSMRPGHSIIGGTQPGGRIMGLHYFKTASGVDKQVAANKTGVWQFDGTDWLDITLGGSALSGGNLDHVRFETMAVSGVYNVIIMNTANTPKIWNGAAATYSNLGGTPGASIDGAVCANRLVLLQAPFNLKISEFNDPATYPVGGGFNIALVDSGDLGASIERLSRTSFAALGEESQWIGRAQSGSTPFRIEKVDEKPGPLSTAAVVKYGSVLYWLAEDYNVYRFDGTSCQAIGWAMKPFVSSIIDSDNRKMAHGAYQDDIGKIFWWFPRQLATAPNDGIFLDIRTGEMGRLLYSTGITASSRGRLISATAVTWASAGALGLTWDTVASTYPTWDSAGGTGSSSRCNFLGDALGKTYAVNRGNGSDNGAAVQGLWEVPLKSYAGWQNNIVPSSFESFFKNNPNSTIINLSVGYTDTLMTDDPVYVAMDSFDIAHEQRNTVDLSSIGEKRFITIRHSVSALYGQVQWMGGLLLGDMAGIDEGSVGA